MAWLNRVCLLGLVRAAIGPSARGAAEQVDLQGKLGLDTYLPTCPEDRIALAKVLRTSGGARLRRPRA